MTSNQIEKVGSEKKEIKFRAWDKVEKKFIKGFAINQNGFLMTMEGQGEWVDRAKYGKERVELMQFTGLLDKRGKEIYEGDIVETGFGNREVEYREGAFWTHESMDTINKDLLTQTKTRYLVVIGNIYQNPELI